MHYRKHDGIAQFYYKHVSNVVQKRNTYQIKIDAGVAFVSAVKCITFTKHSEGSVLLSEQAFTVYAVWK
jgi:hypothetical protein